MTKAIQFTSRVFSSLGFGVLGTRGLAPDVANRLRRGQLRGTIEQMRVMLLGNTLFAPALSMNAWGQGRDGLVVLWTVCFILFSWWIFYSWTKTYQTAGTAEDMRGFVIQTFFNSLSWTIGMALFYPIVEGGQKAIISAIMAGSLALGTTGFSHAPLAGITYLAVQTIGNALVALICGLMTGSSTDYILCILMVAAGISLFNATLEGAKAARAAFNDHERLSEKSEVVELLLKDYEEQATEWLWQTDKKGQLLSAPVQVLEMCQPLPGEGETPDLFQLLAANCTEAALGDRQKLQQAVQERVEFHDVRLSIKSPVDGELRWILMKGRPQFEQGEFKGFRGIFADATAAVIAERKVQFLASFDGLTSLLNRHSVKKKLSEMQVEGQFSAALLVDLDGFKQVNDSYGHHIGDLLLKKVAELLLQAVDGKSWVARLGGDEFLVMMNRDQPMSSAEISWVAQSICEQLAQPIKVEEFIVQVTASIGISRFPEDTEKGPELLSLSDIALYEAKNAGRDRITFFDVEMQNRLNERVTVIERLKRAVRNGDIEPYYQSQHVLSTGRLIGFEALARWNDETLGYVGPDVFIPIAEQTGLIVELGEQLLRRACEDATHWAKQMPEAPPVVSVNFSPIQFARTDVTGLVSRVLHETGLPPELLEVEVTEGVLIASKEKIAATLQELSEIGVSIALDDFGTGYSSLSYLKDLPLNRLKIDQSFVRDLAQAASNPIVSTIVQLGHNLGLSVIAEGVETQGDVELLAELGCDDGQGYLYSSPMTRDATRSYVTDIAVQGAGG
ncbi:EAL domain-containing protein [Pseudophaeobacter sp.]|uniref:putative bifunctional diguanylate cyclase/phosphodiesterase n=1 Tax=Pseudophaeobacter sp. TaxID=1971739 RepID=UPI0032995625